METNAITTQVDNIYPIGTAEDNQIEIDNLGRDELKGLADFINKYLESN